eukprot:747916-Hanusia_phi.AAC.1
MQTDRRKTSAQRQGQTDGRTVLMRRKQKDKHIDKMLWEKKETTACRPRTETREIDSAGRTMMRRFPPSSEAYLEISRGVGCEIARTGSGYVGGEPSPRFPRSRL